MHRLLLRSLRAAVAACALAATAAAVQAHDSWLTRAEGDAGPGLLRLELGVGNRYPQREGGVASSSVQRAACRQAGAGAEQALVPRQEHPKFLELRARLDAGRAVACWAELKPHEVSMTPELVHTYFNEIRPPAALRQRWAEQLARGTAWRESYRKSLRIELPARTGATAAADLAALRQPAGLGLELVPLGDAPIRAAQPASYQALMDGRPVPGLAVEFVSERNPLGVWRETDAQGRVALALPFAGQWLLRAVRLEPPADDAQPWRSRFVTLVVHAQ